MIGCTLVALTVLSASSEGTPTAINPLNKPSIIVTRQFGVASWYGAQFQGLPTASGPPFDKNAMTCAHRELPLRTRIKVTDLLNLRSVVLKVTDRGPYVAGRVLDVSWAAAKRLGFLSDGLAPVRIDIVSYPWQSITVRPGPTIVASASGPGNR